MTSVINADTWKFSFDMIHDPATAKQQIDELFSPLSTDLPARQFDVGAFTLSLSNRERGTIYSVALIRAMHHVAEDRQNVYSLVSLGDMTNPSIGMTLTNNMEAALNHLCKVMNIDLHGVSIIYRDVDSKYTGVRIKRTSVDGSAIATIEDVDFVYVGDGINETRSAVSMLIKNIEEKYSLPRFAKSIIF